MTVRRADDIQYTLLSNGNANGNSVDIKGGEYIFTAVGTLTGATVSLQILLPDGVTWSDVSVYSGSVVKSTASPFAQTGIDLPAGKVRVGLTGGTPTGVYAYLNGLG